MFYLILSDGKSNGDEGRNIWEGIGDWKGGDGYKWRKNLLL